MSIHEQDYDFNPDEFNQTDEDPMCEYMEDLESDPAYEEWLEGLEDFQTGGHTMFWNDLNEINESDIPW